MAKAMPKGKEKMGEKGTLARILSSWQLYVLLLPALIWLILFAYYPMYGVIIAFKDFKMRGGGILGSPWANPIWKYFQQFFSTSIATTAIWNTIVLSLEQLIVSFPIPIIFALLLNQLRSNKARKVVQTISYAPYFLSNVIIVCIMNMIFSATGIINNAIVAAGGSIQSFNSAPEYFRTMYIGSTVWQQMGFNAIVYIAALTGISADFYEAAVIDGATKLQRIIYIDIPLIMPTVILMLILAVGNVMSLGYEKAYLMQTNVNTDVSEIISTYVYKVGLQNAQYSFATAVGLFNSIVNFVILVCANTVSKKAAGVSIF
ncbi:ABC transporter permease [Acutalibacter intestini]|uniref:ABC transporter permease n=1 Tax=Acutalibacter intestini TaxID=3093659 RepID=UPI002AC97DA9|nr:ABC transporter permease subunit [Acutalibacter sp. M00204]